MIRNVVAGALAALLAAPLSPAQEPWEAELAKGVRQVQTGDFESAVATLDWTAKRLIARGRPKELARAYVYLSIAYLGLSEEQKAKAQFLEALKTDESVDLSASEFPPKVLRFFEEARNEARAGSAGAAAPSPTPAAHGGSKTTWGLLAIGAAAGLGVAAAADVLTPKAVSDPLRTPTPTPTPSAQRGPDLALVGSHPAPGGTLALGRAGVVLRVEVSAVADRSGTYRIHASDRDDAGGSCACGMSAPLALAAGQPVSNVPVDLHHPCHGAARSAGLGSTTTGLVLRLLRADASDPAGAAPVYEEAFAATYRRTR